MLLLPARVARRLSSGTSLLEMGHSVDMKMKARARGCEWASVIGAPATVVYRELESVASGEGLGAVVVVAARRSGVASRSVQSSLRIRASSGLEYSGRRWESSG